MLRVGIIGAGFAGLVAAIKAARAGHAVCIYEHMDCAGKKLRATGNGRCNFAPFLLDFNGYKSSENIDFSDFEGLEVEGLILFLSELGIDYTVLNEGYYPASLRADSVLNALIFECERLGVEIKYNIGIRSIEKSENQFMIHAKEGEFSCDRLILATGGKSYKKTGSDGSGYIYAKGFGHSLVEPVPGLCGLVSDSIDCKLVSGVRCNVAFRIDAEEPKAAWSGELQLTDYGISGICVFNLSLELAGKDLNAVNVFAEFCPEKGIEGLKSRLITLRNSELTNAKCCADALSGIFNDKLAKMLVNAAGIDDKRTIGSLNDGEISDFVAKVKNYRINITGFRGFDQAQVTVGGVSMSEINTDRMESKLAPGLFFAGEVMDVQGICGGYNLLWAYYSADKAIKAIKND